MHKVLLSISFLIFKVFSLNIVDTAVNSENPTLIFPDPSGKYYARTTPEQPFEFITKGETTIYEIDKVDDFQIYDFDWYCKNIYLKEYDDVLYIVKIHSAHYGILASHKDTCLSIYKREKHIKSFTTLDLAIHPNNVSTHRNYYTIVKDVYGFYRADFPFDNEKLYFSLRIKGVGLVRIDITNGKFLSKYEKVDPLEADHDPSMLIYKESP